MEEVISYPEAIVYSILIVSMFSTLAYLFKKEYDNGRSEEKDACNGMHSTDWNGKCFKCGKQISNKN